jgi:hypothetical protein
MGSGESRRIRKAVSPLFVRSVAYCVRTPDHRGRHHSELGSWGSELYPVLSVSCTPAEHTHSALDLADPVWPGTRDDPPSALAMQLSVFALSWVVVMSLRQLVTPVRLAMTLTPDDVYVFGASSP